MKSFEKKISKFLDNQPMLKYTKLAQNLPEKNKFLVRALV